MKKVSRTIETIIVKEGGAEIARFTGIPREQVMRIYASMGKEVDISMKEILYSCTEDEFLAIAKPIEK